MLKMIEKEQIKQILFEQRASISNKPFGTVREKLSQIDKLKELPHIVVITGLRRAGKSTFLRQIISKYYNDNDYYYINFEDERFFNFPADNFNDIYETLVELFGEKRTFFIDEIQNIQNFERFVRRFYDNGFKFYITGSNASLLSSEIGSKLTGRHLDVTISPFSFSEYLEFNSIKISDEHLYKTEERATVKGYFVKYLYGGGIPEFVTYQEPEILSRIYEDIIIKDIAVRYGIANLNEMRELYQYLVTNFANRFSFNKLKNIIGLGSVNTVKNYVNFLSDTYFAGVINKFDYSIKKQLVNEKKLYVVDNGFIHRISTKVTKDKGWLLENLVFNELNKSYNITYFKDSNSECDFILQKENKITGAYQVCYELNAGNEKREINGLVTAMNEFDFKTAAILTLEQEDKITLENKTIFVKPIWKWLFQN